MKNAAAIILCAGKGTRMNDDSKNKVCFDCAGIPVIKRIIANMKEGGISRFVIVIGHQAYSVMDCLDGVDGVIYAYQKEQKGTGDAALCGLKALKTLCAPFPQVRFLPTGGVNSANIKEYIDAPFIHAVGGSWVCPKNEISAGNWEKITALCAEARQAALG